MTLASKVCLSVTLGGHGHPDSYKSCLETHLSVLAVAETMADVLSEEQIGNIHDAFNAVDTDHDGVIAAGQLGKYNFQCMDKPIKVTDTLPRSCAQEVRRESN